MPPATVTFEPADSVVTFVVSVSVLPLELIDAIVNARSLNWLR